MSYALNETRALVRKAVRGAGYDWGTADEAAWAVRWLEAAGLDGCAALAQHLTWMEGRDPNAHAPRHLAADMQAERQPLCPLRAGLAVADAYWLTGTGVSLVDVLHPLLLVPFVARAAQSLEQPLGISLNNDPTAAAVDGHLMSLTGDLDWPTCAHVTVAPAIPVGARPAPRQRANPGAQVWQVLGAFAQRTYAPATEASRAKGAGAGLTDND